MQPSLVQRLRDSVTQCRALDRSQLLEEAAAEIERLRAVTEPMPKEKRAEVSFVLTDAERDALIVIESAYGRVAVDECRHLAATLRGLLERLK